MEQSTLLDDVEGWWFTISNKSVSPGSFEKLVGKKVAITKARKNELPFFGKDEGVVEEWTPPTRSRGSKPVTKGKSGEAPAKNLGYDTDKKHLGGSGKTKGDDPEADDLLARSKSIFFDFFFS